MPVTDTQVLDDTTTIIGKPYNVILFNDETHSMDEVIAQLIKATGCTAEKASRIMLEAHLTGRAVAWTGHRERAEHISSVLEEIRLGTKVEPV